MKQFSGNNSQLFGKGQVMRSMALTQIPLRAHTYPIYSPETIAKRAGSGIEKLKR